MGDADDSDDDYMSDKFLNPPVKPLCSGLAPSVRKKRAADVTPRPSVPKGKLMDVKREEGLKKKISEDNVGYRLMLKMGFKGDGGLGKNAEGRAEPVPIEVIDGRRGLGLHNLQKKRSEAIVAMRQRREQHMSAHQSDFRANMASRFRTERCQRQLSAARAICKRLDLAQSVERPVDEAFWPPDETKAKLLAASEVIRREVCRSERRLPHKRRCRDPESSHLSSDDLDEDFDDHRGDYDKVLGVESDEEEYCDIDAAQHGPLESQPDAILLRLCTYMREKHFYCFWCGAQYVDELDLEAHCPGSAEDDHE